LARFELSFGALHFLLIFLVSIVIGTFLGLNYLSYTEDVTIIFDIIFICLFSIMPSMFKPNDSQYQKVNGELWAAHIFVMQKHLPINERILIKSRFIIHFIYT